jgi:hypothetical protein
MTIIIIWKKTLIEQDKRKVWCHVVFLGVCKCICGVDVKGRIEVATLWLYAALKLKLLVAL